MYPSLNTHREGDVHMDVAYIVHQALCTWHAHTHTHTHCDSLLGRGSGVCLIYLRFPVLRVEVQDIIARSGCGKYAVLRTCSSTYAARLRISEKHFVADHAESLAERFGYGSHSEQRTIQQKNRINLTRNQKKHWSGCNLLVVRIQDHWNIWHGADGKKPKATPKGATSQRSDGQGRGVGRQCVPIKHIQNIVFRTLGVAGPTEDGMGSPIGMECEAPNLMKYVGDLVNLPLAINNFFRE